MDVFILSPDLDSKTPVEEKAAPLDIQSGDGTFHILAEEKVKQISSAESQKLAELMDEFAKGFDPDSLRRDIIALLPMLEDNLFPGSYNHLLIILLENWGKMQRVQVKLVDWLRDRYGQAVSAPSEISITDETFFGAEIEMLRKLLTPLRGEDAKPVFWINTRHMDAGKSCQQVEASMKVIEEFKQDVLSAVKVDNEDRSIYTVLPVSLERTGVISVKQLRLDACKATLSWGDFMKSDLELTSFYQFYKAYVTKEAPARAIVSGWLPPTSPKVPHSSLSDEEAYDSTDWPLEDHQKTTVKMLLKMAQWLGLARGLAAVHLFCDVARLFTIHEPTKEAKLSYIFFLQYLTQIRVSIDGIQSNLPTPFPYRDKTFADRNPDYFADVWKSNRALAATLVENVSLIEKNSATDFRLSLPPHRRHHSLGKEIHITMEPPVIHGTLAGSWPDKKTGSSGKQEFTDVTSNANKTGSAVILYKGGPLQEITRDLTTPVDFASMFDDYVARSI